MTEQRWQAVNEMLLAALAQPQAQRSEWLAQACTNDDELRREVESLLRFQPAAEAFLEAPPAALVAELAAEQLSARPQHIGAYEVVSELGRGGMGVVYLARDNELHRPVALKVLPAHLTQDADRIRRFRQEARAVSALNHPNILTLFELGTTTENEATLFLVTEFVKGQTLRHLITDGSLTLGEALEIAIQTANALAAAHEAGIIHRDIKPENLMRRPDGLVKVLDFGLAKLLKKEEGGGMRDESEMGGFLPSSSFIPHPSTMPGLVIGTISYMSPEQARGLNVDARSDIFSLGVVLYEMLTGHTPFTGATTSDLLVAILNHEPPPLRHYAPQLPAALQDIIHRALAKDREQRYQRAADFHDDLKNLQEELKLAARLKRSGDTPTEQASLNLRVGQTTAESKANTDRSPIVATALQTDRAWLLRLTPRAKYAAIALLILLVGALAFSGRALYRNWMTERDEIRSIAVLPFANVGGDPQLDYLSDGLTESVIQSLQPLRDLRVMARGTVFTYKGRTVDPRQVGAALQVRGVVMGEAQQRGKELVVRAELIDTKDGTRLWGNHYQLPAENALLAQREITQDIARHLRLKLSSGEQQRLARAESQHPEAQRLYFQGRYFSNQRTPGALQKSVDYFQQAISQDADFALAHAGLASTYAVLPTYSPTPSREAATLAKAAATKALALDPQSTEAHAALGYVLATWEWDFPGAEREYQQALAINPNDATTRRWYGSSLAMQGKLTEALVEAQRARELDPLTISTYFLLYRIYVGLNQPAAALQEIQRGLQTQTVDAPPLHNYLGRCYVLLGRHEEALMEFQKAVALGDAYDALPLVGIAHALAGRRPEAQRILKDLEAHAERVSNKNVVMAEFHLTLGQPEEAFRWLTRALEQREEHLLWLKVNPRFASLHSDPRFQEIIRRVGLTP